jgi:hypothetical protein
MGVYSFPGSISTSFGRNELVILQDKVYSRATTLHELKSVWFELESHSAGTRPFVGANLEWHKYVVCEDGFY